MRGLSLTFALLSACVAAQTPLKKIEPDYSDEARLAGLEGTVQIRAKVADDGTLGNLEVEKALGLGLDEKALEAVKQWHSVNVEHRPGLLNVPMDFLLPDKRSRWHLTRVAFDTPEGASRPVFLSVQYPLGSG